MSSDLVSDKLGKVSLITLSVADHGMTLTVLILLGKRYSERFRKLTHRSEGKRGS